MAEVDPALWRDIMTYLRRRHSDICRQWFNELEPLDLHSGLLRIETRNEVQQNYLQRKCVDQFREAAQEATGALVSVRFVHGEEAQTQAPPTRSSPITSATSAPKVAKRAPSLDSVPRSTAPGHGGGQIPSHRAVPPLPKASAATLSANHFSDEIVLSPDLNFDNFVVGPGNRLAHAAAVAVANNPGGAYNPLFIHGGVGLGKTHLLQAICQQLMLNNPTVRIYYVSCDAFMNEFMDSVQQGQMSAFRERYRHVDVLVIDDIHFLANRERTQEEFFHTFNALYQSRKQIVLSSDSPPNEIPQLEERLISRFAWGLVAPVQSLDYETRMAIVKSKAAIRELDLPPEVAGLIAQRIDTNARELEGALVTLQGHAAVLEEPITIELARSVFGGEPVQPALQKQITLQQIIDVVTEAYQVKLSDLQSKRRHKSITEPRQICMWLARKHTRYSLQEVGGYFGGRDHTTVMHAVNVVDERARENNEFATQLERLNAALLGE